MRKALTCRMASTVMTILLLTPASSPAFEADVHYGLTQWLALQAGYSAQQAESIARGNQQADSGLMDSMLPMLEYACVSRSPAMARAAQSYHFASAVPVPAAPERREIVANSDAARRKLDSVMRAAKRMADSHLLKLGEALHLLQDSWAHQGVPGKPILQTPAVQCDAALAWATPETRGGWSRHKADVASQWPEDTVAMAAATYQHLIAYPPLAEGARAAKAWPEVRRQLDGFLLAGTKAGQRRWFVANGVNQVAFLQGTSLPDGAGFVSQGPLALPRALPVLRSDTTTQYTVKQDAKDFFDSFFARWLMSTQPASALGRAAPPAQRDLAARLKLWRLEDHGAAAVLAHAPGTLTSAQLQQVDRLARKPGAYVTYAKLADAFSPLLEDSPKATPLLPYIIHTLPQSEQGKERMIAIVKLRHAPYDELGVIAEHADGQWHAIDLASIVSH